MARRFDTWSTVQQVVATVVAAIILGSAGLIWHATTADNAPPNSNANNTPPPAVSTQPPIPSPISTTDTPSPEPSHSTPPATKTPTPKPTPEPVREYGLADQNLLVVGDQPVTVSIEGKTYDKSFRSYLPSCTSDNRNVWEFNLGRKYKRFISIAGITDASSSDTNLQFRVLNTEAVGLPPLYSHIISLGHPGHINVNVTGVLRLRLEIVATRDICGSLGNLTDIGAFGNPVLQ